MSEADILRQARVRTIDARVVRLPFGMAATASPAGLDALMLVLIRAGDNDGVFGYSFLYGLNDRHVRLLLEAARSLAPMVIGVRLAGSSAMSSALETEMAFFGPGLLQMGAAGHRMAVTDLICRRLGVSLSSILGRRRDAVPAYVTGFFPSQSLDDLSDQATALYERGFRAFKLSIGTQTVRADAIRVAELRKRLPEDCKLMVDAAQRWSLTDALDAASRMGDLDLEWIEDPIDHRNTAALGILVNRSPVPIATGENVVRRRDLLELSSLGVPYVIVDLERIGGIDQWMDAAVALADGPSVVLPHLYPHIALQLVACLDQPVSWVEYVTWFEQLLDYELAVDDGSIEVPDVVGTGFSPDQSKVEALAVGNWQSLL